MTDGTLSAIHLHPIKSCRRVEVASAVVADHGLQGDRMWQVVDTEGGPLTQRQHPMLATVRPELIDPSSPTSGLRIGAPGCSTIAVGPATGDGSTVTARTLFGVGVEVTDAGEEAAAWFTGLLGVPARLVGAVPARLHALPGAFDIWGGPIAFSDAAPVLVANTASLHWLNERASAAVGMERFRPNLIVETDQPWAEDTWATLRIGEAHLVQGLPWPRCAMPQVDQDTGARGREPAKVLRQYRWCTSAPTVAEAWRPIVEGNGLFGIGCRIGPAGQELAVGAELVVDSTQAPVLAPPA